MVTRSIALTLLLGACAFQPRVVSSASKEQPKAVQLFDPARRRPVPVILYGTVDGGPARPLAIVSHGYGGRAADYSFIASALVRRGYVVASIEHLERPGDPPMATGGDLAKQRRPVWQIGADSIGFVMRELRRRGLAKRAGLVLVGHSNGGDMTMLFSAQHPGKVRVAFSLDHRRMPVPRTARPRICSARSNDFAADPGVLPTAAERQALGMLIVDVPVKHGDMLDAAPEPQQRAMLEVLSACLDRR